MYFSFHDLFNIGFAVTLGYHAAKFTWALLILAFNLALSAAFGVPLEKEEDGTDDKPND